MIDTNDIAMAREWAVFYKERGFQPLPSRMDKKRPLCTFAEYWESTAPDELFGTFATSNLQVMCGRHWRLLVIDLDGEEARNQWATMGRAPTTWTTISGGGGCHLWFLLPANYPKTLPKAFLWKGDGEHQAIERLCDKSLVMAPPSIHPKTGERYRFASPAKSPTRLPMPADCPAWILDIKPLEAPKPEYIAPQCTPKNIPIDMQRRFDRQEVITAIVDKIGVARSWGLKTTGRPSKRGWQPCHAIGRKDERASAAIHIETGHYVDMGSGIRMSIFDVGVALGIYRTWQDAITDLGLTYASCN
jgi:Bifunctional DNA primase/polymerase, N-terminal